MKRTTKSKQGGVVAVEFALGFFAFWLMIAAWAEISVMSYISSIGDYAIAEASRQAKKSTASYSTVFKSVLNQDNQIWSNLVDSNNFQISVQYVTSLDSLGDVVDSCDPTDSDYDSTTETCGTEIDSAIAIYNVSYDYDSVFGYFIDETTVFSREVIVVQEYERDQF